jgi:NADPH2:quinone reductase
VDSPVTEPNADQVLIKVVVSGSNPKDWKVPEWVGNNINQGDDVAGTVEKVGANVTEFKPGDRVAAFHEIQAPHGSYAEYAVAWAHTTFHIPKKTSFEGAFPTLTPGTLCLRTTCPRLTHICLSFRLQKPQPFLSQP